MLYIWALDRPVQETVILLVNSPTSASSSQPVILE